MREETRKRIEEELSGFPICEYAFLRPEELPFSEKVRYICRTECPRYGKSWACPPAVGSVEECRKRCLAFEGGFLFTTVSEGADLENMEALLALRGGAICERCTYPDAPCRHPERMLPSVEGQGILVTELAEKQGLSFQNGSDVVTWFSLILYEGEKTR